MTDAWGRRELIGRGVALGAGVFASALPAPAEAREKAGGAAGDSFTFLHYTDIHVEPELHATQGFAKAIDAMKRAAPGAAFALCGGDLVFDANAVPFARAAHLYDLYGEQSRRLGVPIHHCLGNHDIFALGPAGSGVPADDPHSGKSLFLARTGLKQTYYSFDHANWHFAVLDTVQITTSSTGDRSWRGFVDDAQMVWLAADLEKTGKAAPTILLVHMPILCAITQYTKGTTEPTPDKLIVANGKAVKELIQPYNVKAVLQGHTHVVEEIAYLGARYISAGAVCGDWWKGWRLGVHPEGFTVCTAHADGEFAWRYVPYGWAADKPA